MVTAWVVKRKNLRLKGILTTVEFYGDKMTKEDLEKHYSGNPDVEVLSIRQVDPQTAYKVSQKWTFKDEKVK